MNELLQEIECGLAGISGWTLAVRTVREMIEQSISDGPEKHRLLSHMADMDNPPFPSPDAGAETLAIAFHKARTAGAQLLAIVRRYEPEYFSTLTKAEKINLNIISHGLAGRP